MKVKLTKKVFIFGKLHSIGSELDVTTKEYSEKSMIKLTKTKKASKSAE